MKTISIIPSKSDAHRALIAAALSEDPCEVICEAASRDIEATSGCLAAIAEAKATGAKAMMDAGESGSTLRFLLPVVGALGIRGSFALQGRLAKRPLSPLYEALKEHGMRLSRQGVSPLSFSGHLKSGAYALPGNVSSQFITGLLFALPILPGDSTLTVTGRLESAGYVDMTLRTLDRFGIRVERVMGNMGTVYEIPGGQRYQAPADYRVEGDWSNAAFWLAAGAIGKETVAVTGLSASSAQGDKEILDLLRRFGAEVKQEEDRVTVHPAGGRLTGIEIDAGGIPDLVPVLSLVASVAKGETLIRGAGRLRAKESDRLTAIHEVLGSLGAEVEEMPDALLIRGKERLTGGAADSVNDHRIAMMAAIASLITEGPVTLTGWEAASKSYPSFYEVLRENDLDRNLILK